MFDRIEIMKLFQLRNVRTEDKKDSVDTVHSIIQLAVKARNEGIISIEDDVENSYNELIKQFMGLVIKGTEVKLIEDILYLKLVKNQDNDCCRFDLFIIWLGIHLIYDSVSPELFILYFNEAFGYDAGLLGEIKIFLVEALSKDMSEGEEKIKYIKNTLESL